MNPKKVTYNRLILFIIFVSLVFSLVSTMVYSAYLKRHAIEELAKDEAKKTSLFVFESLYSAMSKGVNKAEIAHIITRLNGVDPNLDIEVYRSAKVAELFGDEPASERARTNDIEVKKALEGEALLQKHGDDYIRYLYPVEVQDDCLRCHTNVAIGDINGVIDLRYNISNIRISLNSLIKSLISFFLIFLSVIFIFLYLNLKYNVVNPIGSFIATIKTLMQGHDLSKRVELKTKISEIKDIESFFNQLLESLQKQFYTDSLTGLPNRRKVFEVVGRCESCTMAIINIDDFSQINDFYGSRIGDLVLIEVAKKIETLLDDRYTLYRLGGDEYALIKEDTEEVEEFEKILAHILKKLEERFVVEGGQDISLNLTGGAAIGCEDILIKSNIALKNAKKSKKDYLFYEEGMFVAEEYENNIRWTQILKEAIRENRLTTFYQPIVNNQTGKIEKYETLIRMVDKDGTVISPYFFLDIAKRSKLYPHITRTVIKNAFEAFEKSSCDFSINLSVNDILDTQTAEYLKKTVAASPASDRVVFELLESEGIENYADVSDFINYVKRYGCKIAVDDFGTGYSNFEYLLEMKVDYIKIDAAMIKNIDRVKNSELVTETIVDFAKKLGIKTIAEFVHSKEVYEKVKSIGVDYSQGYYLGKPESTLKEEI